MGQRAAAGPGSDDDHVVAARLVHGRPLWSRRS
jgi:hypothetical protein